MLKRIWQWLKGLFRRLFGGTANVPVTISDTPPPKPLDDSDYEFFFRQLLEGVVHGWQQPRIVKFFEGMKGRVTNGEWVAWLNRFGQKVLASRAQNHELARQMLQLGEMTQSIPSIQDIGAAAYEIGRQILTREHSGVVWEYEGPDFSPRTPPPPNSAEEDDNQNLPEEEVITLDELLVRLQQDPNLVALIAQQFGLETDDPQVIIDAVAKQLETMEE